MSIYFDVKTIRELIGDNYREQREFTLEELAQYDGSNGKPAYVAIEGIVYELSEKAVWANGTHFGLTASKDLTEQFKSCHGAPKFLSTLPKVGILKANNRMNTVTMNRSEIQNKSNFTPDDWVRYITPLVNRALAEAKAGINPEHLYQEFILSGVLVGLGKTPQEAIEQVEEWEKTGVSKLLAMSKMNRFY
ncbi:cytochrome b5 domain-containing protein [Clostridium botulinum]|uniref:cytochrome b5 domain-containing protein n=2 Tax=Clostridium botulinum TaxID=1491 RepID=UPI001C9A5350|nr:cytochrome b5 domain-containing protein [Clostridium botulinum]MBY6811751.1 cytochrome b5 [Clostridium botulinum]MBY6825191.1 cytochrome b5 [Clostridium botulinum]MBY6835565.1 cytochrome b5 [Clostridium botulinum]MBY6974160.1 cytochrome b5 [Clostridium botulinum]MCS6105422.1 cytochrome b5 [Clostridium botulinum]